VRDVVIPPHLLPVLGEWQRRQPNRTRDALLFPAGDGVSPLSDSVLRDAHGKGQAGHRCARLTIHGLRHTSATLAAQLGATLAESYTPLASVVDVPLTRNANPPVLAKRDNRLNRAP